MSTYSRLRAASRRALLASRPDRWAGPLLRPVAKAYQFSVYSGWLARLGRPSFRVAPSAPYDYERRYLLYEHVVESQTLQSSTIAYLEFGVHRGASMRWWIQKNISPNSRFVGFDTFTGLPESWHTQAKKGAFSTDGQFPDILDPRCSFEVGLFQATLFPFLERLKNPPRLVLHLDADLYGSTMFVLFAFASRLRSGDLLLFDEFSDVLHEFRAFEEFTSIHRMQYECLGEVNDFRQVAFRVL